MTERSKTAAKLVAVRLSATSFANGPNHSSGWLTLFARSNPNPFASLNAVLATCSPPPSRTNKFPLTTFPAFIPSKQATESHPNGVTTDTIGALSPTSTLFAIRVLPTRTSP